MEETTMFNLTTIAVAIAEGGRREAAHDFGEIENTPVADHHAVILPIAGRKLKSITDGTRSVVGEFEANTSSGVPAARLLFKSSWRPVYLSWWRHGCWIRLLALECRWAFLACRYQH